VYSFGKRSKKHLSSCCVELQQICNEVIKVTDFAVICGHRSKKAQNKAYKNKKSMKKWPTSRHNSIPSTAVDIVPFPVDWENIERFYFLAGAFLAVASSLGIKITWGGHWKRLRDYPHFQLQRRR
jgi:hypothetical protein